MDQRTEIELLPEAARAVTDVVEQVPDQAWGSATPCGRWTVRDVLSHLTAEHLWTPHLLSGESLERVGDRYDADLLGDAPGRAWRRAVAGSMQAWGSVRDVDAPITMSFGPVRTGEYAQQMLLDLTVHAWDLARGAGAALRPVPDAVERAWAYEKPRVASGGVAGIFGSPVPTDSQDRLDQLVALLGRDPAWTVVSPGSGGAGTSPGAAPT